ncbi:Flagellar motor switch protein FliM [Candidatus Bealeia paramacronuclearis]|uniref:Flagellar motor switch protein FliM n=1 Tax=Candidatus Bealeia paramacronuclearis TaxID=1921001 RepID=A0ABZ2C5E4_9PROT|nr:Flagellar motor switch protein FliM [Candidatus Bealeia paramacronuclearis]
MSAEAQEQMLADESVMAEGDKETLSHELSQEEIDSLLGISGDASEESQGLKALIGSSHVTYERLPMLEVIFDRLVRLLSTTLRNFTGDIVDVSLEKIDSIRFGDYIDSLPLPILISVFEAAEWGNPALVTIDTHLVYSIVDLLLGGRKGPGITKIEGRPYTTIERNLVERMIHLLLEDFTKSFSLFSPVTFKFKNLESNPRFAVIARPVNACILIRLKIEMDERGGFLEFVIPYATLEPVREQLLQMVMGEKFGRDSIWENHFEEQLFEINVDLEAILDPVSIPLSEVLKWEKGSQIVFKAKPSELIPLCSGKFPLFLGKLGQKEGNISLKISKVKKLNRDKLLGVAPA